MKNIVSIIALFAYLLTYSQNIQKLNTISDSLREDYVLKTHNFSYNKNEFDTYKAESIYFFKKDAFNPNKTIFNPNGASDTKSFLISGSLNYLVQFFDNDKFK